MKRNNLTTAVIAGIAGVAGIANMAGAVNLNPDGLGQVLIYPYFTVNANNQTLISVVNTQNAGKAVKVRFLEGYDSREVLDFNLYLSPYDVWVAAVFDTAGFNGALTDGSAPGGLLTPDNSCTDPGIKKPTYAPLMTLPDGRFYVSFTNAAYSGIGSTSGAPLTDGGPTDLKRTRTGHIELIEMATVTGDTLAAITHDNTGVPADCNAVIGLPANSTDLHAPSGGLFGSGSIVNAAQGTLYGYNADAIDGFYTVRTGNIFFTPGVISPDLTNGDNSDIVPGASVSYVFNNGKLITSTYVGDSIDAVSSVFTADHIYNEFEINPTTGSVASEWVVTFPTKRYYVDPATHLNATKPFTKVFGKTFACEPIGITKFNREEGTNHSVGGFSPPQPGQAGPVLCYEAQVITFGPGAAAGTASPIFGSPLTANIDPSAVGNAGWVNLDFTTIPGHAMLASTENNVFHGLPVTGFLAKDFTNKNVTPGVLGNYAGLYRHRISRACTNVNGTCS